MDKKYQVFVSSTFGDLRKERQAAIQALLRLGFIPAGMEFFTAVDEEQMVFIKKIIDDCDYYLLLIGGRYLTGGGDVEGGRFRLEVMNLGKTPAFLSHYDIHFKKLAAVEARPLPVRRRYRFDDRIPAANQRIVIDRIPMPPDTEIIFGAFWYQDFLKREHLFRFILRIAPDGHTRPDVTGVDGSYSHWD